MALLLIFALLAGAGTALSPCILPVLPIALSAGATGGRRRPLGIVTGLAISFTFATVALVYVIDALGLPDDLLRVVAIVVLLGFGIAFMVPPIGDRIEAFLSARFSRLAGARAGGKGFAGGFVLGLSLGLVYAPCAGPILAGIITVSASQDFTAGRLAVALAYGIGSAIALYVLILGGRRVIGKLSARSGYIQQALGATMALVAVLMLFNLDTRFQTAIASDLPSFLVNPTEGLETSASARERLARLRGGGSPHDLGSRSRGADGRLPVLGEAPDIVGTQKWFNTPGGRKLRLDDLRGRVTLIDFWTYTCINCIRTLPQLKSWDERYRDRGLSIIGIHTPEFAFEKDAENVGDAIDQNGIRYPVGQDNEMATWNAFANQYWPAKYLIDAKGRIRYTHFGEGGERETEDAIRSLLAEAGRDRIGPRGAVTARHGSPDVTTPEIYLGSLRNRGTLNGPLAPGVRDYGTPGPAAALPPDAIALAGSWRIDDESATAGRNAQLDLAFGAERVFLVLSSPGRSRTVRVLLNGEPLPDKLAGADVRDGRVTVTRQRLYDLVNLPHPARGVLTLRPEAGVAGYAFTFG